MKLVNSTKDGTKESHLEKRETLIIYGRPLDETTLHLQDKK